jgi:hypothetical protein
VNEICSGITLFTYTHSGKICLEKLYAKPVPNQTVCVNVVRFSVVAPVISKQRNTLRLPCKRLEWKTRLLPSSKKDKSENQGYDDDNDSK